MSFSKEYQKIYDLVEEDIKKLDKEITSSISLSPFIDETLREFLTTNSKRIRPVLAFLYLRAIGIQPEQEHFEYLTAIEIIHNASLIHDDVIDEAETRRGASSINNKFNNKTAILTGDYLLTIALNKLNFLKSPETITMCTDTLCQMCQGEINQYFNKFKITTLEEYLNKTEAKTAKLFQIAISGCLLLSQKSSELADKFAYSFGMAFQIRDDILNITQKETLKPSQNDIQSGIYNAPVIFSNGVENLDLGIAKTRGLLNNYIDIAEVALSEIEENIYKQTLIDLLGILKNA